MSTGSAAQQPQEVQQPQEAAPAPTPEDLAAQLEARRRALVSDVDELAARMAPASLKRSAVEAKDSLLSSLRAQGEELSAQARQQAQGLLAKAGLSQGCARGRAAAANGAPGAAAMAYGIHPAGEGAADSGSSPDDECAGFCPANSVKIVVKDLPLSKSLGHLLDDARDGDPMALAIVTGAVLGLAGLSGVALIKAISNLRAGGTVR